MEKCKRRGQTHLSPPDASVPATGGSVGLWAAPPSRLRQLISGSAGGGQSVAGRGEQGAGQGGSSQHQAPPASTHSTTKEPDSLNDEELSNLLVGKENYFEEKFAFLFPFSSKQTRHQIFAKRSLLEIIMYKWVIKSRWSSQSCIVPINFHKGKLYNLSKKESVHL